MLNLLSKRREHFVLALVWLIFWSLILVSVGSRINQHGLIRTIAGKTSTSRVQVWPWTFVDEADFDTRDFAHVVNHVNLEGVVWQGQPGQSTWRIIHTGNLRVQIDRQIILDIKERVPLTATDVPVTWERNHFDLEIEFAGGPAVWDYDDPAMQMGIYERTPWGGWRLVSPYRLYPTIPEATLAQREMVASAVLDVARIAWWMGVIVLAVLGIWHSKLWRQPSAWAMAGILPLGLLARYLSLLYQEAHSPFFYYYAAGSDNYVLLARELLAGELGFASTHYYVNPGNIYWLSWWMLLVGLQQRGLVLVNILLAVLSVCVLTVATWKAFGRQAGIFCGLIAAIFPAIIDFQTNLTVASPLISFTMLTVGAGLWISQRPTWQSSVWFGLANGFAVLLRPTSLFVGPAIFMALMVARDSSAPWRGWKRIATLTLTAAFCSFVVTGPQIAANIASGQNIIQSAQMGSNGPITLYIGANQDSSGQIEYFRPAFLRVRHGDANWNKAIAADVVAKPMRTFQLYLHKLGLLWSNLEYSDHPFHIGIDSDNGGRPPQYPWLGMTTLAFLGISGNMATLLEQSTKRSMAAWFLVCCTLLLMLAIATYPVIARYRVPIYPPLCVAAGLAIQRLIETIKQRHLMRSLVISAGLAGTLLTNGAS